MFTLLCAGSASAAASTAAAPNTAHRVRCSPAHAKVIARNAHAVVFKANVPTYSDHREPLEPIPVYIGCVFGSARSFTLGVAYNANTCSSTSCDTTIDRITLSGRMVAFVRSSETEANVFGYEGSAEWVLVVRSLRTGRTVHSVPTGTDGLSRPGYVGTGDAVAIVLKADGAVVWITDTNRERNRYELHALDTSGNRVLAEGSDIDRHSLALSGSTVYWRQGGKRMSATLD
jgi:hypothetical protein